MFKAFKKSKNYLLANDLIVKGMFKRRRLAVAAIAHVCDNRKLMQVVK